MKRYRHTQMFEMKGLRIVQGRGEAVRSGTMLTFGRWAFALGILAIGVMPRAALAVPRACIPPGDGAQCTRDSQCCAGSVCAGVCRRGCKIDRVFYANGAINPTNDCQWCQGTTSRFAWTNIASGIACGDQTTGECTNPNTCNGSGSCLDNHEPTTTTCGDAEGQCTNQDYCDGSGGCTDNDFKPDSTHCTGDSQGDECDDDPADHCTGTDGSCVDEFKAGGTFCGDSGTQCRNQDTCDGLGGDCTDNGFKSSSTDCTGASQGDECDNDAADHCTGTSNSCVDMYKVSGTSCGDGSTQCRNQDSCDGLGGDCVDNGFKPDSTSCTGASQGDECDDDAADHCTGTSNSCVDVFKASGTSCGSNSDTDCDNPDTCNGTGSCQVNNLADGTGCTTDGNDCTTDVCAAGACTHPNAPASTHCTGTANGGSCDDDANDQCNGNGACVDAFRPSSYVCDSDTGPFGEYLCKNALYCSGTSSLCPDENPNIIVIRVYDNRRICRPSGAPCDPPEYCDGLGSCSPNVGWTIGQTCPGAGPCEKPYACDINGNCASTGPRLDATCEGEGHAGNRPGEWCDIYAEEVLNQPQCGDFGRCVRTVCRVETDCENAWSCDNAGHCLSNGYKPSGQDCIGDYGCVRYRCDGAGHCADEVLGPCLTDLDCDETQNQVCVGGYCRTTRHPTASCRAPANECDVRDRCGDPSIVPSNGRNDFRAYPACGPDEKKPFSTPCTYNLFGQDAPGKCIDGACNPFYCKNSIDCPDGWVCGCPAGLYCETPYCIPAPADGGYGDVCAVAGRCDKDAESPGRACTTRQECDPGNIRPDAKCVQSSCDFNSGIRQGVGCESNSECRNATHPSGECVPNTRGDCGSIPNTTLDYVCCAGMQGDGLGGTPALGLTGRCQECCDTSIHDACFERSADLTCCDGKCTDVMTDIHNCVSCNYDGSGYDCTNLVTACSPSVVKCDALVIGSGCVMSDFCSATARQEGWTAAECYIPEVRVPVADCDYCVSPSATPGRPCLTEAECGGFAGITNWCYHRSDLFCLTRIAYTTDPECRDAPFAGCTPSCCEIDNDPNVGHECESDDDCRGGTSCITSCDIDRHGQVFGAFFCGDNPTCQFIGGEPPVHECLEVPWP